MHLTINSLIFLYFLILDSISIVFTTLSTLFLDEHVVETIALQEIDTIVVPFVTLAHAHIGGNHDVSFTIMHTGDVGITGNAKLLREIWGEFTNNGLFLLIIIHGTGDGIAWNVGRRGTDQKTKEREERKKGERKKGGKRLTKPGTPYKGPTSAHQAQQIQKDKERQKLAKELKNRKIAEQNRRAREKAANINRRRKAGKAYLNNLTK